MKNFLLVFSFLLVLSCSKDNNPCEGIVCLNGGFCVDGICVCSEMYQGSNCSDEKEPKEIILRAVTISNIPLVNSNGNNWDSFSAPDFQFSIQNGTGNLVFTSEVVQDHTGNELGFIFDAKFEDAFSNVIIRLEEVDITNNEGVDITGFGLNSIPAGFPTNVIHTSGEGIQYDFVVQYRF